MTIPATRPAEAAFIGRPWVEADTPALLVDLDRMEANIAEMAAAARDAGVGLRPHFKTHKSVEIARRQMEAGAIGITVAKLDEAAALIGGGITDVFLANELVGSPKLERAMALAGRARLSLGVDNAMAAQSIAFAAREAGLTVPLVIEIDCGLHRCGIPAADAAPLAAMIAATPGIDLDGVFTHAGHVYAATSREQIEAIAVDEAAAVRDAAERIAKMGIDVRVVSVGSTPTAARVMREKGVTELRAGNYIFYDAMQIALGTIPADRPALSVSAVVISRPTPERAVIDAGSKTFGLDKGAHGLNIVPGYGRPINVDGTLERLSEEHGVFAIPANLDLAIGDHVQVIPNHACAVGNLGRYYYGVSGGVIQELIAIDASGGVH